MKGKEKYCEKLPDYQGKRKVYFLFYGLVTIFGSLIFQLIVDSSPRIFPFIHILQIISPLTPIFNSIIIITIGFFMIYNYWRVKDSYLEKFGNKAYQKSFKYVVIGITMLLSILIHAFFPTDFLSQCHPNELNFYLGIPISNLFPNFPTFIFYIRIILWILFLLIGLRVILKSLKIFGIDYMGLIYVYYPEESTLQNQEIYSILRHPTYHGIMLISISSIFLRFSLYSIVYYIIFLIGINLHLKLVEENELINRFGEKFQNYKEIVPALFIKFKDLKKYFSFLL